VKRILLIVVGVLVLLVVVVGGFIAAAFMGRKPTVDGFEINGMRVVEDGFVTATVVPVRAGQVALIDAGNDTEATALLAELSRRGLGPDAVTAIFLTHGHPDHMGGVLKFPKAEVIALDREAGLVAGTERARNPLASVMPSGDTGIKVTRPLRDGQEIMVGDVAVRAFAVPGHTDGSAAYLVNGVLFMGDSADQTSDGGLRGAPWIFSNSQPENRASLRRLAARLAQDGIKVTALAPAHSGVLTDGLAQLDAFSKANPD